MLPCFEREQDTIPTPLAVRPHLFVPQLDFWRDRVWGSVYPPRIAEQRNGELRDMSEVTR